MLRLARPPVLAHGCRVVEAFVVERAAGPLMVRRSPSMHRVESFRSTASRKEEAMSLFDRHLNPLSPAFLVVLVLAGIAVPTGSALAQQDNLVTLNLASGTDNMFIMNQGRGTGICRPAMESAACPSTLTWEWTNPAGMGNTNRSIVIEFLTGTAGAFRCFEPEGIPAVRFQLTPSIDTVEVTVSSNCPAKSAWIYRIRCLLIDTGLPCPDVAAIDPGVIIR